MVELNGFLGLISEKNMKKTCLSVAIALTIMGVSSAHATLANGQPYTVSMDAKGFMIDGQYRLLRGGTVQCFVFRVATFRKIQRCRF